MSKEEYKKQVLEWIKENKIDISNKRVRVYKYRGEWEVRVYSEPQEIQNTKKSFRERKEERDDKRHGSYGIHTRKISLYTHINETDFEKPEEREFILEVLKGL